MRNSTTDKAQAKYAPQNFERLLGTPGFSDKMLKDHFKLYEGYVKNSNDLLDFFETARRSGRQEGREFAEARRRFGWEFDGMRLHEYYFGNLAKEKTTLGPESALLEKIAEDFGSLGNWHKEFTAVGAIRGIGWAVLTHDAAADRLINTWIDEHDTGHLAACPPLLVMDVFEHAYMTDYGIDRAKYIGSFMEAVRWPEVQRRFDAL